MTSAIIRALLYTMRSKAIGLKAAFASRPNTWKWEAEDVIGLRVLRASIVRLNKIGTCTPTTLDITMRIRAATRRTRRNGSVLENVDNRCRRVLNVEAAFAGGSFSFAGTSSKDCGAIDIVGEGDEELSV